MLLSLTHWIFKFLEPANCSDSVCDTLYCGLYHYHRVASCLMLGFTSFCVVTSLTSYLSRSARETHVWTFPEVCGPRSFLHHISLSAGPERRRPLRGNLAAAQHDHPRSPITAVPDEDHPLHLDGDSHHILGHRSYV